jgi:hypothetical protein
MADIAQVIANYDALVGVALGAGLTYGFSALNRRHQEARENETRWYEKRFNAYSELSRAVLDAQLLAKLDAWDPEARQEFIMRLTRAVGEVRIVGSDEAAEAAWDVVGVVVDTLAGDTSDEGHVSDVMTRFNDVARKDLGHPLSLVLNTPTGAPSGQEVIVQRS